MGESGELKQLHENVANLTEASESAYINLKDRLMNIINAGHAKEDEIYETLMDDHEVAGIRKHNVFGDSIFDMMSQTYKMASVENLSIVAGAINSMPEKKDALEQIEVKLMALLGSKVKALEQLVELQAAYIEHVENDAANEKLLLDLQMDLKRCEGSYSRVENPQESEASESLKAQTEDLLSEIENTKGTFAELSKANTERNDLFSSIGAAAEGDRLESFRLKLIQHLSMNIVVKENRSRYQKEQFDRMIMASQDFQLKQHDKSLEDWCHNYSLLIESLIDKSHNYMSPKIQANYDDFADTTIKPLNSTIFYYFFSGDRARRTFAQWLLATARYPNQRVKRAYMRFFA